MRYLSLKMPVAEDGQTAETSLTIKIEPWNRHIMTSHHNELSLYRRKENNLFLLT